MLEAEFPLRLTPTGPFLGDPPLAVGTLAYHVAGAPWEQMTLLQEFVNQQVRVMWAIKEIAAIRVVAQHPWAWDLIGVTQWARRRR